MLRIGVRGSKLALAYADMACKALDTETEIVVINSAGDLNPDVPISEIGGKGVFCSAIEQELLAGNIDVAIHSLKDMPGDVETPGLVVNAVLKRNSSHDVLIGKVTFGSVIGTSSPRRTAQLLSHYASLNIQVKPIRGNIDTRLAKLEAGDYDALILAEAGLDALGIINTRMRLPFVPAVGQGIIALQTRDSDLETNLIVKRANHKITFAQAQLERSILKGLNGDCHTKVAAHATGSNPIKMIVEYYE
tara:strand:- start:2988 stop:3731 length:744 start_codon:yes stop_codon:yes gene_type:complete